MLILKLFFTEVRCEYRWWTKRARIVAVIASALNHRVVLQQYGVPQ
jgi:hypothetical protein